MKNKQTYILASFAVPVVIMVCVCLVNGIILNGDNSILFSDLSNIYADHLMGIKHLILEGKSLVYNWNIGGGINYLPYVLGNLNLTNIPVFITPDSVFQEMILITQIVRIGLAGVSCYVYLANHYDSKSIGVVAFSSGYAVSGYSVCFVQTISWYEPIMLLPVLVLLTERLVKGEKMTDAKVICVLVYTFFTSYYIGYMISFFLLMYTIAFAYKNDRNIFRAVVRLGFNGAIAAGIAAVFLLPVFGAILDSGEVAEFHFGIKFRIEDIANQFFIGAFDTYKPDGRPLLYCGTGTILLVVIYMLTDVQDRKSRIADIALLLVMFAFLVVLPFYYVWHMFDHPDWFEGRFTFIIIFYIVAMAYGVSEKWITYGYRNTITGAFLLCGTLYFCSQLFCDMDTKTLIINYILIIIYSVVSVLGQRRRKLMTVLLSLLMWSELLINAVICSRAMFVEEGCESCLFYKEFYDTNKKAVAYIEQNDNDFYRIEKDYFRRENDLGAAGGKALSSFGTFYNRDFMAMLRAMGIAGGQAGRYIGGTPVTDIMLSVRYMISSNKYDPVYDPVRMVNGKTIFRNPYETGIGMLVNPDMESIDIDQSENPIELQNEIVRKWEDRNENVFYPANDFEVNIVNLYEETGDRDIRIFNKINISEEAYIDIIVKKHEKECLYAYIPDFAGQVILELNGMYINDFMGQKNKIINLEKDTFGSDYVTLRIKLNEGKLMIPASCIYVLDIELLDQWASGIRHAVLENFSETEIQLRARCGKEELLLLSIPFDRDWKIYINGEQQESFPVFRGLTCVRVGEGDNEIQIIFEPKGFRTGMLISLVSVLALIILRKADV